ncbi:hypothetical protein PPERSA_13069 [Pseudocohnilembus persalinus]|uniref:Transmembrane protein n=1 Tax=Pseudocohnilembus persalinus TaxID=266149 RepID=A0A0V0QWI2_PSEPJ|nr:hypothetical protein PPERSA_13069 [Pseudocohnilembus persalinus]|eukprot:KRX06590.1 hypothetical protein PPERSA_13069 [Pseudocohnilembus persalinus]
MSISVQDECSSLFGCIRTILFSVICLVIMGFTIFGMKQIHQKLNKWSFEIIPLATTLIQAMVQFIMIFFYSGLDIMITGLYVQNTTFSIVCMSFVMLYYRTKYNLDKKQNQNGDYSKLYDKEDKDKDQNSNQNQSKISNGSGVKRSASGPNIKNFITLNNQDSVYYSNQSKLILSICITFAFTGVAQVLLDILREKGIKDQAFTCDTTSDHKMFDPNDDNIWGQLYMVFYQLVIIIPCTYVPYAFYYVPFGKRNRGQFSIDDSNFMSFNIDEQDQKVKKNDQNGGDKNINDDNFNNDDLYKQLQQQTKATIDYCGQMDSDEEAQQNLKIEAQQPQSLDEQPDNISNNFNGIKDTFALADEYNTMDYIQKIDNRSNIK